MNNWLFHHYDVQKGMYFDNLNEDGELYYFSSDMINDSVWNYGLVSRITKDSLEKYIIFCNSIGKATNLYIPHKTSFDDRILLDLGFIRPESDDGILVTETWMKFTHKKYVVKAKCNIKEVVTQEEKKQFIDVFLAAYGGEKTPEKPYGDLPVEYTDALSRSFFNSKFHHFICYNEIGNPVSVASLCMNDGYGGLYNIGTPPAYEKNGFGLAVTDACINKWFELNGKELFLQTETGTGIDSWYNRIGFENLFFGSIYEKQ